MVTNLAHQGWIVFIELKIQVICIIRNSRRAWRLLMAFYAQMWERRRLSGFLGGLNNMPLGKPPATAICILR